MITLCFVFIPLLCFWQILKMETTNIIMITIQDNILSNTDYYSVKLYRYASFHLFLILIRDYHEIRLQRVQCRQRFLFILSGGIVSLINSHYWAKRIINLRNKCVITKYFLKIQSVKVQSKSTKYLVKLISIESKIKM